jgi:hypothetical protein
MNPGEQAMQQEEIKAKAVNSCQLQIETQEIDISLSVVSG